VFFIIPPTAVEFIALVFQGGEFWVKKATVSNEARRPAKPRTALMLVSTSALSSVRVKAT